MTQTEFLHRRVEISAAVRALHRGSFGVRNGAQFGDERFDEFLVAAPHIDRDASDFSLEDFEVLNGVLRAEIDETVFEPRKPFLVGDDEAAAGPVNHAS